MESQLFLYYLFSTALLKTLYTFQCVIIKYHNVHKYKMFAKAQFVITNKKADELELTANEVESKIPPLFLIDDLLLYS